MSNPLRVLHVCFVAALTGFAALSCVFATTVTSEALGSKKDFWDIASAVGTCSAVVVALWLGIRQDLIRRRESMLSANLLASQVGPQLAVIIDSSQKALAPMAFHDGKIDRVERYTRASKQTVVMAWRLPPADLAVLVVLPSGVAFRLARGISLMNAVSNDMSINRSNFTNPGAEWLQDQLLSRWIFQLEQAIPDLLFALDECTAITNRFAR